MSAHLTSHQVRTHGFVSALHDVIAYALAILAAWAIFCSMVWAVFLVVVFLMSAWKSIREYRGSWWELIPTEFYVWIGLLYVFHCLMGFRHN